MSRTARRRRVHARFAALVPGLVVASLAGSPSVASAQDSTPVSASATESGQVGCFRGRPLPECRSFWILEFQGLLPLARSTRTVGSPEFPFEVEIMGASLEWTAGHMWNLDGGPWAVGGTLTIGTQADGLLSGLRARGRRWLSPDLALEGTLGYALVDVNGGTGGTAGGVSTDLRINIRDQGAFFVRWDRFDIAPSEWVRADYVYLDEGGVQHAFLVGASAGSLPAIVGSGLLGVGFAVLFGIYVASST